MLYNREDALIIHKLRRLVNESTSLGNKLKQEFPELVLKSSRIKSIFD